jgi:hypothetical protein
MNEAMQRLLDRAEIQDCMARYARGVDRGDWETMRAAYHPDAYDDHVDYKGDIDGLVAFLKDRFEGVDNSMHFLGNCLIEYAGPDAAFVETYFTSRRVRKPSPEEAAKHGLEPQDGLTRQSWGRYLDRFERRDGAWKVAKRIVVLDSRLTSVAKGALNIAQGNWCARDRSDPLYANRAEVLGGEAGPA